MEREKTLADRVYALAEKTGLDTMIIMNTYIGQESKLYIRNITSKNRIMAHNVFENQALNIMERYTEIHYGRKP